MGDQGTDNLQELEDSLAESYAAEDGGTGLSYYNDSGYDYDASSSLTDIDYQPSYNESLQFTSNGVGADDYNPVVQNEASNEDVESSQNEMSSMTGGGYGNDTFEDDYDDEEDDDFDGDDESEDSDDASEDEEYDEDSEYDVESETDEQESSHSQKNHAKKNHDKYNGAVKWKPGQPITVELLDQIWGKCRKIDKVRPMTDALNEAVEGALNSSGPNLMLRLNQYISKINDSSIDTVGCLLKLAKENGRRLTLTAVSAVEAIFDQQWLQTVLIASFNKSTLQSLFAMPPIKGIANKIFTVAVPIINAMERKKE